MIEKLKKAHPITLVIETLGMSRSTYYAKLNHEPSQRQLSNEKLSKKIKNEFFSKLNSVMVHLKSMLNYLDKENVAHSNEFRS